MKGAEILNFGYNIKIINLLCTKFIAQEDSYVRSYTQELSMHSASTVQC